MAELADLLGIDQAALLALEQENIQIGSLDTLYDDHAAAFADQEPDPFQALAEAEDSDTLTRCITQLPERLQTVLQLYFVEELNLAEIADILDVSVPRIHQLKASALSKMREMMT
ncbi:sigma-70 family RNA polymerase sigma factor [Altererythrobacter sp. ZODW24]|uniref:sigma-70 family RNA polymerase sigma factor n=1 Tax=Altererythrobacter sp. ZODW24 TaxID=2185142 RepID=UPI000DF85FC3|nr:sigma-70 family RNA polymerase sigma factor [Altererythrobacter sp. ZODW24]